MIPPVSLPGSINCRLKIIRDMMEKSTDPLSIELPKLRIRMEGSTEDFLVKVHKRTMAGWKLGLSESFFRKILYAAGAFVLVIL
ncbi:MAG: hypothetical protein ACXU9W_10210, partial [Thermodesulfobacteriota bacterium]